LKYKVKPQKFFQTRFFLFLACFSSGFVKFAVPGMENIEVKIESKL